jgi:peptide/nickel transport system substrate-binding protein
VKLNVLAGDAGSRAADIINAQKTPLSVTEVGRADPDVIKSQFYYKNRDGLLLAGGLSATATFEDPQLNALLESVAGETDPEKRLANTAAAQKYIVEQAYNIPLFEEPQVFAGAPYLHGLGFEAVGRPSFYTTWLAKH